MSEFRKSYEYEEEKGIGGLLMLFFVMLLSVEVLLALMVLIQGYAVLKATPYLGPVFLVLGITYLALVLFACIALRGMARFAIALCRRLLAARVLFLTPVFVRLFAAFSRDPRIVSGFRSRSEIVAFGLVVPLAYLLLFSGLWYWYLASSPRVRRYVQTASARRDADQGGRPGDRP